MTTVRLRLRLEPSRWVTGPEAIHKVHEMRHECMSIMVSVDTVIADDLMATAKN